jgi:hypothetical protein
MIIVVDEMEILKYVLSIIFLVLGFIINKIQDAYSDLFFEYLCSAFHGVDPKFPCDKIFGLPDFGELFLIVGIVGLFFSVVIDLNKKISVAY